MTGDTRRTFLQKSGTIGLTIVTASASRTYAANERITGDEDASGLLSRKYREGGYWAIPKGV